MTKIITIANQKGGVGKSTTAVTLGHGLAMKKKNVLLLDLDPQGQLATLLRMRQESCVFDLLVSGNKASGLIRESGREGLALLPGDKRTNTAEFVMGAERRPISYLQDMLKKIVRIYDYIIIDTSPSIGDLQAAALYASDLVLIPSACDFLSVEGAVNLYKTLQEIQSSYNWSGRLIGVLPTFYDETTSESREILATLNERFNRFVLDVIHRATILRECAAYGQTVFELDGSSRAAKEYQALVNHVIKIS